MITIVEKFVNVINLSLTNGTIPDQFGIMGFESLEQSLTNYSKIKKRMELFKNGQWDSFEAIKEGSMLSLWINSQTLVQIKWKHGFTKKLTDHFSVFYEGIHLAFEISCFRGLVEKSPTLTVITKEKL